MDAALLSNIIKDLLLDNDSVSLKGLGRFVARVEPSTFADRGFTVNPPYRKLSFEKGTGEDNLLEERFVALAGGDAEEASRALRDYIADIRAELEEKKVFILPGIGRLRATAGNNFFLVADEDLDIYPEGFGLVPLSMRTRVETPEEVSAAVASLGEILAPEHEAVPAEEPAAAEEKVPEAEAEPAPAPKPRKARPGVRLLIAAAVIAVAFFGGLYALGRLAPDLADSLLYSADDLQYVKMLSE